jgi:hypothetical protein
MHGTMRPRRRWMSDIIRVLVLLVVLLMAYAYSASYPPPTFGHHHLVLD